MVVAEEACWLALLSDTDIDRAEVKSALYRLTVVEERLLSECAGLTVDELQAALPSVSASQLPHWRVALGNAPRAQEQLSHYAHSGIKLLTRSSHLYPESLAERLPGAGSPYLLFYRGDVSLLDRPVLYASGPSVLADAASDWTRTLAAQLSTLPLTCAGLYAQGAERLLLDAVTHTGGSTVLMLPLGVNHAAAIMRAGQDAVERRIRLELSPYLPDTPFSPTLGRASRRLATALSDVLVLVEPEEPPADWPGLEEHVQRGGQVLCYGAGQESALLTWEGRGALRISTPMEAVGKLSAHLGLDIEQDQPSQRAPLYSEPESEVRFESADAAIARLQAAGRVPEGLRRRLRDAEKRGILGGED